MLATIILALCGLTGAAIVLIAIIILSSAPVIDEETIAQREEGGLQ